MTTDAQSRYLSFEDFRLDCRSGGLRKSKRKIRLNPSRRSYWSCWRLAGEVVTRAEIQSAFWGEDTFVDFEHGVNFSIKQIRKPSATPPKSLGTSKPYPASASGRRGLRLELLAVSPGVDENSTP